MEDSTMIRISLCMIVKNEEQVLERCLKSVADLMDEIIIVDTGSDDHTKEIAAKYTDKLYDYVWREDFSAARNFSFEKASMDYIYIADADEILDETNRQRFKRLKAVLEPEVEIVQMKYCNQLEFGSVYNFDTEYRAKLYKRQRQFRWIDPIHETVALDPVVYNSDIEVIHRPLKGHQKRDFEIFRKITQNGAGLSKKLHSMYAKELFISGTGEDFLKAENYFHAALKSDTCLDGLKETFCVLARIYRLKKNIAAFFKTCLKDVASESVSEICYELGEYFFETGDYEEALIWYYNAAYETGSILNIHMSGDYAYKRLSECSKKLGNKEEAELYEKLQREWKPVSPDA